MDESSCRFLEVQGVGGRPSWREGHKSRIKVAAFTKGLTNKQIWDAHSLIVAMDTWVLLDPSVRVLQTQGGVVNGEVKLHRKEMTLNHCTLVSEF